MATHSAARLGTNDFEFVIFVPFPISPPRPRRANLVRRGEGQWFSPTQPRAGGQNRLYREVLPKDRLEFGLGRFAYGANVRLAFFPYTLADLPLDLRPENRLNSPMIIAP